MTETKQDIRRVIALGVFDGVHIGHGALLEKVKERSAQLNAVPAVLTFDIHPDYFVNAAKVELINSPEERVELIRRLYGIDDVIMFPFNREVMMMPWDAFLRRVIEDYHAEAFVVGEDFTFGYKGEGNAEKLSGFASENQMLCDVIAPVILDGVRVSSTQIREFIRNGEIEKASKNLGHPYCFTDIVRYGFQLGRTISAPTVNMLFPPCTVIPKYGVYASEAFLEDGRSFHAITNVGVRPTVSNGASVNAESHLLDFCEDLYGQRVRIELLSFLRQEMRFENLDALSAQIKADTESAREFFESYRR